MHHLSHWAPWYTVGLPKGDAITSRQAVRWQLLDVPNAEIIHPFNASCLKKTNGREAQAQNKRADHRKCYRSIDSIPFPSRTGKSALRDTGRSQIIADCMNGRLRPTFFRDGVQKLGPVEAT